MHPDSLYLMTKFREAYRSRIEGKMVLDVGSQDINGNYRGMFEEYRCQYLGTDVVPGANVDVVTPEDKLIFGDDIFDVVISGQVLEHAKKPWELVKEMARVLTPGGLICCIAPWKFHVHKDPLYPYDRWRILDDGMRVLLEEAELVVLDCQMYQEDTYGIAEKPIKALEV